MAISQYLGVFRYSRRAIELVWQTSRVLTVVLATGTLIAGLLPAAAAWVGQLIVDGVVAAIDAGQGIPNELLWLVALEGGIMMGIAGAQRAIQIAQSLLRAQLGQRVNVMILEKAQSLQLADFEDSEFYDKLTRARREASSRPLSLVNRTFGLIQNGISLASFAGLLLGFSPWAVLILVLAGLPQFSPRPSSRGMRFGCSAGAAPTPAGRCISRPSWPARTAPRRSSSFSSARCCCSATGISSGGSIARTGA